MFYVYIMYVYTYYVDIQDMQIDHRVYSSTQP